jgi:hypothetical protein
LGLLVPGNEEELTVFAFALLDQVLVLDVLVTSLAVEPGPKRYRK